MSGHNFFHTFDGKNFIFPGKCTYQLAADCIDNSFAIHMINDPDCSANPLQSCRRSVNLYLGGSDIKIHLDQGFRVTVNNLNVSLPYVLNSLVIQHVGSYVLFYGLQDITVKWDGHSSIYIEVPRTFANKTCGLCGNYDGSPNNDLEMKGKTLTTSVATFGNSWRMVGVNERCQNVYDGDIVSNYNDIPSIRKTFVDFICQNLNEGAFQSCHSVVNINPYIEQCKEEVAACNDSTAVACACNAFTQYSRECARNNVVLDWRRPDLCREFYIISLLKG